MFTSMNDSSFSMVEVRSYINYPLLYYFLTLDNLLKDDKMMDMGKCRSSLFPSEELGVCRLPFPISNCHQMKNRGQHVVERRWNVEIGPIIFLLPFANLLI